MTDQDRISIKDAAARGISRLRASNWYKEDYLVIDLIDGGYGPWVHLYSPLNEVVGVADPQDILIINLDTEKKIYEPA